MGRLQKRRHAAADEQDHHQHDEQRLVQRKTDDTFNHGEFRA